MGNLNSAEGAAVWARRILPAKNTLRESDARQVEEAFEAKLTTINGQSNSASVGDGHDMPQAELTDGEVAAARLPGPGQAAATEPRRVRDRDHLRFVSTQPCLICGRTPADPHHLRFAQSRALGRKVSDEWVVALCRGHHREVHRHGDEHDWWGKPALTRTLPHEVCGYNLIVRVRGKVRRLVRRLWLRPCRWLRLRPYR